MTGRPQGARSIDETLAAARARLLRVTPAEAFSEFCAGAILIDIRPAAQRAVDGEIPGSVIVERNHLEWRFDPASDARLPWADGYDLRLLGRQAAHCAGAGAHGGARARRFSGLGVELRKAVPDEVDQVRGNLLEFRLTGV